MMPGAPFEHARQHRLGDRRAGPPRCPQPGLRAARPSAPEGHHAAGPGVDGVVDQDVDPAPRPRTWLDRRLEGRRSSTSATTGSAAAPEARRRLRRLVQAARHGARPPTSESSRPSPRCRVRAVMATSNPAAARASAARLADAAAGTGDQGHGAVVGLGHGPVSSRRPSRCRRRSDGRPRGSVPTPRAAARGDPAGAPSRSTRPVPRRLRASDRLGPFGMRTAPGVGGQPTTARSRSRRADRPVVGPRPGRPVHRRPGNRRPGNRRPETVDPETVDPSAGAPDGGVEDRVRRALLR